MRREPLSIAIAVIALAVVAVAGAIVLRPPADLATPSPSPTASPMTSPSPAASPTTASSPLPSPTPQGEYVSKRGGFALTLPPPWRKAACGNPDPGPDGLAGESFTSATVMEETFSGVGSAGDVVFVQVNDAQGRTPAQLAERWYPGTPVTPVTFAGRPAVEVRHQTFSIAESLYYYMPEGDRIYAVGYHPRHGGSPEIATMLRILRSFRFVPAAERAALPDPTPIPAAAPTAQTLAVMLKAALEQKDIAAIERLLGPCVGAGARPGGGSSESRERFVAELRQQFAAGLTVTVDATLSTETMGTGYTYIGSRWNQFPAGGGPVPPGQPQPLNVQLLIGQTQGGVYWSGTLVVHTF